MKNRKMKKTLINLLLWAALLSALTGCAAKEPAAPTAPTAVEADDQQAQEALEAIQPYLEEREALEPTPMPKVEIKMPEYEMAYAGEMRDLIITETLEDADGIRFSVKLSDSEAHIFTMLYNTYEGELVTVLKDAEGNQVPVAFMMPGVPEGLSAEDELMFYTAQESVNDIVSSLVLK